VAEAEVVAADSVAEAIAAMVVVAATLEVATIEHLAGKPLTGDTFEKRPGEQKLVGALTFAA
jgi:hypothetical protein